MVLRVFTIILLLSVVLERLVDSLISPSIAFQSGEFRHGSLGGSGHESHLLIMGLQMQVTLHVVTVEYLLYPDQINIRYVSVECVSVQGGWGVDECVYMTWDVSFFPNPRKNLLAPKG